VERTAAAEGLREQAGRLDEGDIDRSPRMTVSRIRAALWRRRDPGMLDADGPSVIEPAHRGPG
jgi:hypothetical protein